MKYIYLILCILFFSCDKKPKSNTITAISKKSQNLEAITKVEEKIDPKIRLKKELNYLKRRDINVAYFKNKEINDKISKEMNDSLLVLEKLLKDILTNTKIKELDKKGKINLETFFPEVGFGMLDGLLMSKETTIFLCTSKFIFSDYFFKNKKDQFNKLTPSNLEGIFNEAFYNNANVTNLSSFKITTEIGYQAYGMIGLGAQDTGAWPPNALHVLVLVDDVVYLLYKPIKKKLKDFEYCTNIWNSTYINDDSESEERAWKQYCNCYQKEFKNSEQFLTLKKEIDAMLKLITQ